MTQLTPSESAEFVDQVLVAVRSTLDTLDRHENTLGELPRLATDHNALWSSIVNRLQSNLQEWQTILDAMAEKVRTAQEELNGLDTDLNQALRSFATARKHLQGGEVMGW
jgi:hypothetical protein